MNSFCYKDENLELKLYKNSYILTINKIISINEYYNSINEYNDYLKNLLIHPCYLIRYEDSFYKINKQQIIKYKIDKLEYVIIKSDNIIRIIKKTYNQDIIYEDAIEFKINEHKYSIFKFINDINLKKFKGKWYPEKIKSFKLEKKEALKIAQDILDEIFKINFLKNFLKNINNLYNIINLVPNNEYYPIINNNTITLSWPYRLGEDNINKNSYAYLDIILNETREKIGEIDFDYLCCNGFTYSGNVSYSIKEEFQGNHYATISLSLLIDLLKKNDFKGDKDLYIATLPENIKSQHVIMNNNGKLFYEGSVPKDNYINYIDGITKVKVFKIIL